MRALAAAEKLGISTGTICIDVPSARLDLDPAGEKGAPVAGGGVMFRGRAVEKLAPGLPTRHWEEFDECPHENLENPSRFHLDCFGNVQICQGISLGNMWETPLSEIVEKYEVGRHKICAPLARGGPARLARECAKTVIMVKRHRPFRSTLSRWLLRNGTASHHDA